MSRRALLAAAAATTLLLLLLSSSLVAGEESDSLAPPLSPTQRQPSLASNVKARLFLDETEAQVVEKAVSEPASAEQAQDKNLGNGDEMQTTSNGRVGSVSAFSLKERPQPPPRPLPPPQRREALAS